MSGQNSLRYSRHSILPEIGLRGQRKLTESKVAIVGIGSLGAFTAELLARAGIGNLLLIDRDIVELSNLSRQMLFDESNIGYPKADAAKERLSKINSHIKIQSRILDINHLNISVLKNSDIILDCTDNLETRMLVNDYCKREDKTWIHSAAIRWIGTVFNIRPDGPCLQCILHHSRTSETCETSGILNATAAAVSSIQASECIKLLVGLPAEKGMLRINLLENEISRIKTSKWPACNACNGIYKFLSGHEMSKTLKLCGSDLYQISLGPEKQKSWNKTAFARLKKKLTLIGKITDGGHFVKFRNLTIFDDGRALVQAEDADKAISLYARFVGM